MTTTGLFVRGHTQYDNVTSQARRDVARRLATVGHLIAAAGHEPDVYAREFADDLTEEVLARPGWSNKVPTPSEPPSIVVHRLVSDKARLLAIDLLTANHRPPPERERDDEPDVMDDTARSRLFARLEVDHVRGIDTTARTVGGVEDGE